MFKYSIFIRTVQVENCSISEKWRQKRKKVIFCLLFQTKCLYLHKSAENSHFWQPDYIRYYLIRTSEKFYSIDLTHFEDCSLTTVGVVTGATTNMYLLTLFSLTFFVLSGAKTVQTECIIKWTCSFFMLRCSLSSFSRQI